MTKHIQIKFKQYHFCTNLTRQIANLRHWYCKVVRQLEDCGKRCMSLHSSDVTCRICKFPQLRPDARFLLRSSFSSSQARKPPSASRCPQPQHVTAMVKIRSPFTDAFDLSVPVVGCPMAGVAGPELAAAVARAGGLGFLGSGEHLRVMNITSGVSRAT